jgi:hypothetical protein
VLGVCVLENTIHKALKNSLLGISTY